MENFRPYVTLTVNGDEYHLKFSAAATIEAEKKLGKGLLMAMQDMMSITTQVTMLWAALQKYHHGITMDAATDIYDAYVSGNGSMTDFVNTIVEALEVSGFTKPPQEGAKKAANNKNTAPGKSVQTEQ